MRCMLLSPFATLLAVSIQAREQFTTELALETFDAVWEIIDTQHFDPEFNGADWPAVRIALRPRAEAAKDMTAAREVIREMLAALHQSHFSLIEKDLLTSRTRNSSGSSAGTAGFDIRIRGDHALVSLVEPGGPAHLAGIRTGWVLHAIDGVMVEDLIEAISASETSRLPLAARGSLLAQIDGEVATKARFSFRTTQNQEPMELELTRVERDATPFNFRGLPTFYLTMQSERIEYEGATIGLIHFSNWFPPIARELDDTLISMRDCDGIVLDLRGNSGGAGVMARRVAGHFFSKPTSLGTQLRRGRDREYSVKPFRTHAGKTIRPFLGPVALLTDETTGSCSEVFAGGMQALGRAKVFGERTAGATLPSHLTKLPNGDFLQHAIASFITPRGDSPEGVGVLPDRIVPLRREPLLEGRDVALEAARTWIASQRDD